ncbi:MAG: hypothetical protein QUV05_08875 [Phycisphaerae bacterium]|nr:hypothetical protein [Phycisphaerae bacterium]
MPSHRIGGFIVVGLAVCLGLVLWARAGDLNPPAGPVAPTMKTLDQLSAEHAQLASAVAEMSGGAGGVKQVVHGCIEFDGGVFEASATFSPEINPSKSVVVLGEPVLKTYLTSTANPLSPRNGACLVELTSTTITVRVDDVPPSTIRQVSYQIIEYN